MIPTEQAIAERVKLARRLAGLTQKDAADALGVTERTYARWERNETGGMLERLGDIAEAFGTTVDELRGGEGEESTASLDAKLDRILAELRALRELLSDPAELRRRADALIAEERGQ